MKPFLVLNPRPADDWRTAKIKIQKRQGSWWCMIPGPIPEFSKHQHWLDALAKAQLEFRGPYR